MSYRDSPKGILKNDYFEGNATPGSVLGLQQSASPKGTPKTVSIHPLAESISPLILGNDKNLDDFDLDRGPRKPKIRGPNSKRLSGRPSHHSSVSSLQSFLDQANDDGDVDVSTTGSSDHHLFTGGLVGQITAWVREEKAKRDQRKAKRKDKTTLQLPRADGPASGHRRKPSESSIDDVDFDRLEQLLKESFPFSRSRKSSVSALRRKSSARRLHKSSSSLGAASSDTEYFEGDALVPSAEAWLDNSKTLAYNGGAGESNDSLSLRRERTNTQDAWIKFKFEIVRLTHTLRLKGWRRVSMEMSSEIDVERLSGALTNAVYVVSPPADLPQPTPSDDNPKLMPKRPPPKLLLRIYGPQVEHLIDREEELKILRRLARKKIGPRMLGTFANGRFEEFFNARPLTPADLRNSDTSRQIAKRMRELHDGIDLLEYEREEGAFVWRNWDKWVQRVEEVVSWLDGQIRDHHERRGSVPAAWLERGYVCGTEWALFKQTVEKYRTWLDKKYGGPWKLREGLVFAHNDTQYGNILRLLPSSTSPLLLPANTHKQLVVIDFEYASANTPGLEFANHFTEWCYNYHDEKTSWRCNTAAYPTPDDQRSFIRAYVRHRPEFNIQTPRMTPMETLPESRAVSPGRTEETSYGTPPNIERRPAGPSQSISNFMLDARAAPTSASPLKSTFPPSVTANSSPTTSTSSDSSTVHEETEISRLLRETQLWRLANTAQWVAWGIVQARVPGMPLPSPNVELNNDPDSDNATITGPDDDEADDAISPMSEVKAHPTAVSATQSSKEGTSAPEDAHKTQEQSAKEREEQNLDIAEEAAEEEKEAEFDYLAYARDRAMFFWGDAVNLGFVKLEDLPEDVRRDVKIVKY